MVGNQVSEDKDSAGSLTTEGAVTGEGRAPSQRSATGRI